MPFSIFHCLKNNLMKNELRIKYKRLREQIAPELLEDWSIQIANNLLKLPIWDYTNYHIFLSIPEKREVDTEAILHILHGKDKNIILSKSNFETHSLTNYLLTDSTLIKTNKWGIPEPQDGIEIPAHQIEVVFIPLLAFDKQGHRIGYGKGFYDRFLAACNEKTLKVGLSFFEAEEEMPEVYSTDIPMDYCVTPKKVYEF